MHIPIYGWQEHGQGLYVIRGPSVNAEAQITPLENWVGARHSSYPPYHCLEEHSERPKEGKGPAQGHTEH